jgi:hypothetical protein
MGATQAPGVTPASARGYGFMITDRNSVLAGFCIRDHGTESNQRLRYELWPASVTCNQTLRMEGQ